MALCIPQPPTARATRGTDEFWCNFVIFHSKFRTNSGCVMISSQARHKCRDYNCLVTPPGMDTVCVPVAQRHHNLPAKLCWISSLQKLHRVTRCRQAPRHNAASRSSSDDDKVVHGGGGGACSRQRPSAGAGRGRRRAPRCASYGQHPTGSQESPRGRWVIVA